MLCHRRWTAELAVRSLQTLTMISVVDLNWCWLHVEIRHKGVARINKTRRPRKNSISSFCLYFSSFLQCPPSPSPFLFFPFSRTFPIYLLWKFLHIPPNPSGEIGGNLSNDNFSRKNSCLLLSQSRYDTDMYKCFDVSYEKGNHKRQLLGHCAVQDHPANRQVSMETMRKRHRSNWCGGPARTMADQCFTMLLRFSTSTKDTGNAQIHRVCALLILWFVAAV